MVWRRRLNKSLEPTLLSRILFRPFLPLQRFRPSLVTLHKPQGGSAPVVGYLGITMFKRMMAEQLKNPSGLIGRYVLAAVWNRRNAALNDGALTRLRLDANDQVLDVGFGGGYLIEKMLNTLTVGHVSGVDSSAVMVEQCRRRFARQIEEGNLDVQCAMVDSLPYPDGSFHKVSSVNSLFYWPDFRRGIRELRRVLATNGLLVLAYTCKHDLDKRGLSPFGVRSFTDDEVEGALQEDGFHTVLVERQSGKHRDYSIVTARK